MTLEKIFIQHINHNNIIILSEVEIKNPDANQVQRNPIACFSDFFKINVGLYANYELIAYQ